MQNLEKSSDEKFKEEFAYAFGQPQISFDFKLEPEDFRVTEIFDPDLSGDGEHLYLYVEKRDQNTRWVAAQLAEYFGVDPAAVGYAGLKDRRAVTRQWFSSHLPREVGLPTIPEDAGFQILSSDRHGKKLRIGDHQGNAFEIRLRNPGAQRGEAIQSAVNQRISQIAEMGAPNYFGEQRFGHHRNNLREADKQLQKILQRHQTRSSRPAKGRRSRGQRQSTKGIYLSAARSWLFNRVLSHRIISEGWPALIADPSATGPLWGRGRSEMSQSIRDVERSILSDYTDWQLALEHSGLTQERRPLALKPEDFHCDWIDGEPLIRFRLPPGQYATSVLREICQLRSPQADPVI
ncbi:MAG: tRNA pseudouridine(13) synthase TruD [bacterium]